MKLVQLIENTDVDFSDPDLGLADREQHDAGVRYVLMLKAKLQQVNAMVGSLRRRMSAVPLHQVKSQTVADEMVEIKTSWDLRNGDRVAPKQEIWYAPDTPANRRMAGTIQSLGRQIKLINKGFAKTRRSQSVILARWSKDVLKQLKQNTTSGYNVDFDSMPSRLEFGKGVVTVDFFNPCFAGRSPRYAGNPSQFDKMPPFLQNMFLAIQDCLVRLNVPKMDTVFFGYSSMKACTNLIAVGADNQFVFRHTELPTIGITAETIIIPLQAGAPIRNAPERFLAYSDDELKTKFRLAGF